MKKKKKIVLTIIEAILTVLIIGLLNGCSNPFSLKNKICGMWASDDQLLELKKDGTFYLDKSIYRKKLLDDERRTGITGLAERDRAVYEAFPDITGLKITGKWKIKKNNVILTTDTGSALKGRIIEHRESSDHFYYIKFDYLNSDWFRADKEYLRNLYAEYRDNK